MRGVPSLLAGRNTAPLTDRQIGNTFEIAYGLDRSANLRYDPGHRTVFRVYMEDGVEKCEIVFGPDIVPGNAIADPNSILSIKCAVAHELSHKSRYENGTEVNEPYLEHLDEALTSLGAISRFSNKLDEFDFIQLAADAVQRIQMFIAQYRADNIGILEDEAIPAADGLEG